jgi:hypothetical protein
MPDVTHSGSTAINVGDDSVMELDVDLDGNIMPCFITKKMGNWRNLDHLRCRLKSG